METRLSTRINHPRTLVRVLGVGVIAVLTCSFVFRDLVWTGHWRRNATMGMRSATLSAPWPSDRGQLSNSGFILKNESVYATARIPRPFERLTIVLAGDVSEAVSVGVETKPNTHSFRLLPCMPMSKTNCSATIPLDHVDQHLGTLNLVVRTPSATTANPKVLQTIELDFERSPLSVMKVVSRLWAILKSGV